ncbi:hypothetical protein DPMN_076831 [Dreissena polymorpha]|uniref:Uncharacterized protein n=1 Tax=Dreissena polymorpha TaxID=45954 RepID=A0A9D4BG38_DREPO|nr:hypothetical protein DPMN_076831 [Dreissena polymorpha]
MYVRDAWTRYVQLMEDPLPRWSLMADSLMLRPASAIWVIHYVLGEAENLQSSPDAALPGESLRSSYQY